jgi:hypothetical protein
MRRTIPLAGVLFLGALLQASHAQSAAPPDSMRPAVGALIGGALGATAGALVGPPPTCEPAATACPLAAPPSLAPARVHRAGVVEELIALLDETQSRDTYLATVLVLSRLGGEAKPALPAALRNAERLGLLRGLCKHGRPGKGNTAGTGILDALAAIAQAPALMPPYNPPPPAYAPPAVYVPATPPPPTIAR